MAENSVTVRYGTGSKSYENEFFRTFASSIKEYFESKGINAYLLGMPECLVFPSLQIDALLITPNTMTIIDFKNYGGTLTLPDEDNFDKGEWKTADGVTVEGGSRPNPFAQTGNQRNRLKRILEHCCSGFSKFDPSRITTVVCFQNQMKVHGSIPKQYQQTFFITDKDKFLTKLFDIVNIKGDRGLLNPKFLDYFNEKIFQTEEYDLDVTPESLEATPQPAANKVAPETNKSLMSQLETMDQLENFFKGDAPVLIITGTVGSGKMETAPIIRQAAFDAGFDAARVFAYSNRIRRNLLNRIEDVESLHAAIYDFSATTDSEDGKRRVPLSKEPPEKYILSDDETTDENKDPKSVFIVYESQMISDTFREDNMVQLGTGKLLSDLLNYLNIGASQPKNKVIFVGDKYQLSFGSWAECSLNPEYYDDNIDVELIELPDTKTPTGIQSTCLQIANAIRQEEFSNLALTPNEQVSIYASENEKSLLESAQAHWQEHKILCYTNKQAAELNLYIKQNILTNGSACAPGDVVLFTNEVLARPSSNQRKVSGAVDQFSSPETIKIENGEFGIVEAVGFLDVSPVLSMKDDSSKTLTLANAIVRLGPNSSNRTVEINYIKELLESGAGNLEPFEEAAIQIRLRKLIDDYIYEHPFEKSSHYREMIQKEDFQINDAGQYRDPDDARKLTIYESTYRQEVRRTLMQGNSEYAMWSNAARIKYGWCMTVHKSMSNSWNEVTFSTKVDRGRTNKDYFRFLYTGISRANSQVNLVRWTPISPFKKTVFGEELRQASSSKKDNILATFPCNEVHDKLTETLKNTLAPEMELRESKSSQYQEIYVIGRGNITTKLIFDYNKKGEIKLPRKATGDNELFTEIVSLLNQRTEKKETAPSSPIAWLYDYLKLNVLIDFEIEVEKSLEWQDIVSIHNNTTGMVKVAVYYKKDQTISSFKLISGSQEGFKTVVNTIKKYYGLTSA